MVARRSRTAWYSSASFASSSRACRCHPSASWGVRSAPGPGVRSLLGPGGLSVARSCRACAVHHVTDGDHEALACGVIAAGAGGVGAAEPVVCGVEKPLENHRVRHTREVPLRVPMRGGGWQLASGAVVGLIVGGGDEVLDRQEVVAGKVLVRHHVGASERGVRRRSVVHPVGNRGSGIARSSRTPDSVPGRASHSLSSVPMSMHLLAPNNALCHPLLPFKTI
jgi:hypothetical protein